MTAPPHAQSRRAAAIASRGIPPGQAALRSATRHRTRRRCPRRPPPGRLPQGPPPLVGSEPAPPLQTDGAQTRPAAGCGARGWRRRPRRGSSCHRPPLFEKCRRRAAALQHRIPRTRSTPVGRGAGRGGVKDAKEIWQRKQCCPVAPRTTRQSGIGCSGGTAQCTRASRECQIDAPAQMFQSPTCGSRLLGAAPASERGTEQSQNGGLFADDRTGAQRSQAGSKPWALRDRGRFVNRRREAQSGALERRPGRRLVQTSPFAWGRDRSAQRAVLADGRVGACAYAF